MGIFSSIKSGISEKMSAARDAVSAAISRIKELFKFQWSLPKIKLPHFKVSGSFSLNPPSVPSISIDWYKKAMNDGMILNSPTIFGQKGHTLLAGGEAGSEAIVGTKSLMGMIKDAVSSASTGVVNHLGGVNINVYAREGQDARSIALDVADILNNQVLREGSVWA